MGKKDKSPAGTPEVREKRKRKVTESTPESVKVETKPIKKSKRKTLEEVIPEAVKVEKKSEKRKRKVTEVTDKTEVIENSEKVEEKQSSKKRKVAETDSGVVPEKPKVPYCRKTLSLNQGLKAFDKEDIRVKANAAVHAMFSLLKQNEKTQLFASTGSRLKLLINAVKLHPTQQGSIKITLPYPYLTKELGANVVLITPSKKGFKKDYDESLNHYKNILRESNITYITEIIPVGQLKAEYIPDEMRSRLSNRCDILLADPRIIALINPFLGKPFYSKKKFPVAVNLEAKDLNAEFQSALSKTYYPVNNRGTSSMVQVGVSEQSAEQIISNIVSVCEKLCHKFPGHWNNIRDISLKADDVKLSIPVHISFRGQNEVRRIITHKERELPVIGECSTLEKGGQQVAVYPDGQVRIMDTKLIKKRNIKSDDSKPSKKQRKLYAARKMKMKNGGRRKKGSKKANNKPPGFTATKSIKHYVKNPNFKHK